MNRAQIIQRLSEHKGELDAFGVRSLSLFGSVARGEERPGSDIDILVEFERVGGLFEFVRLKNYLEKTLGQPVDLVTPDALKPQLREKILRESIHAC
ncbi:MAG TPA: nucleotidyltransferase family protein [Desulfuromonadales bacterium]|nr:nucleotidyltransferase family protein [Desulfuromonadales bacterium]